MRKLFWIGLLTLLASPSVARTPESQRETLTKVGFSQNLNTALPLDTTFRDEQGKMVALRQFFQGKPVILALVYYECPMLCTETLNGLVRAMRALSLTAGKDYQVVTVSFDPKETAALAAAKKRVYTDRYGRTEAQQGWAFLTGDAPSIDTLTRATGFRYAYDSEIQQFAHATGIMVATPQGRLSHYFYGVEYSAKDLRLALVDASAGKIGNPVDHLLMYCFRYDPTTGRYGLLIINVVRLAAVATLIALAISILIMNRSVRRPVLKGGR